MPITAGHPLQAVELAQEADFALGGCAVRPSTREFVAGGQAALLEPRIMQVLVALALRRGEVVSREELVTRCWGGRVVGDDAINRCISAIRKLSAACGGFTVTTVARVGYRLDEAAAPFAKPSPQSRAKPSIAVLPFANVSDDPERAYFADGMLLEIVEALSRIKSIFVIASGSSLSFRDKKVTAQDAACQLGVRYVLEGSVRKSADRVRIGVLLVDAADGTSIWSERFEDTLDDVFALQDKVALAVAGRIEPTVQQAEIRRALKRPTKHMGSYDLYLRSIAIGRPPLQTELSAAIDQIDRAISLDPDFGSALAWASLARWLSVSFGWSADPAEALRQSAELAHRALRVADGDAQILTQAAQITAYVEHDVPAAIALMDRALALNPGSDGVWFPSAHLRLLAGDAALAVEHVETAMRLDPLSPNRLLHVLILGHAQLALRRYGEALTCFKELAQQQPENVLGHLGVAAAAGHLGQTAAAQTALADLCSLTTEPAAEVLRRWDSASTPELLEVWLDGLALAEAT